MAEMYAAGEGSGQTTTYPKPQDPIDIGGGGDLSGGKRLAPITPQDPIDIGGGGDLSGGKRIGTTTSGQPVATPPNIVKSPTTTPDPNAGTTQSATQTIDAWANSVGLGALAGWINSQIQLYAGQGMSTSDISSMISSTINKAPGFDAIMPGYNQRIANGFTNTDASTGTGIAGYMAYTQQVRAYAETAGLVPGTITAQDIGNSWANDVSTSELSDRITNEYVNAVNAAPTIQKQLEAYGYVQGLSHGQLASYYLNPENTVNQLQQQFNAATVGAEGTLTGFGQLEKSKAYALQAFLSNSGTSTMSPTQAANFFSSNVAQGTGSLAAMAQTGFEKAQLGAAANGPGVVSQDKLLQAGMGNANAVLDVQRAAQTRAAPSAGGGGLEASQSGVGGVGFGTS